MTERKVLVLGLDCAAPQLVFDWYKDDLPHMSQLAVHGLWGELESCIPAITVPAWSSMMSSKDPGTLGIYGFRNRSDYTYTNTHIANGKYVKEPRVWEILGQAHKHTVTIGVPQTFPIKPANGATISSFLTPNLEAGFTYPPELAAQVLAAAPRYALDVRNFRTDDKDWLLQQIWDMTEQRFTVLDMLMKQEPWDFFMWVEMGVDRIHHGMWRFIDPQHPLYEAGNKYENSVRDYYKLIDAQIGRMLERIDDHTLVLVVSDHGAKAMHGGICVNEWLWREGYLALKEPPEQQADPETGNLLLTAFDASLVDWSKTRAWGEGGYYARIFLNVEGREPEGAVSREDYEPLRAELSERMAAITGLGGEPLGTRVFKPQDIYKKVRGVPPDLLVYWGDLSWRSVGTLGHGAIHTVENDTGPDDANHASNGMFILYDPKNPGGGRRIEGRQLMDVAPTLLDYMQVKVPFDMQGNRLDA